MIKANLESCGRTFENHLLLSHMSKVNRRSVLPPQVLGDQSRLQQVLINLIRNAIDNSYISGSVQITINYDYKENQLIGIIKDNGLGIQKDQQQNIFSLLHLPNAQKKLAHLVHNQYKAENDKVRVGLGLFISMQLVKSYGGQLDFISEPLNGSTFIFTFNLDVDHEVYQQENLSEYERKMLRLQAHYEQLNANNVIQIQQQAQSNE